MHYAVTIAEDDSISYCLDAPCRHDHNLHEKGRGAPSILFSIVLLF